MLINIVFCVSTVVLCNKNMFKYFGQHLLYFSTIIFFETDLLLVDEQYVTSLLRNKDIS